jgi:hypothetical protein
MISNGHYFLCSFVFTLILTWQLPSKSQQVQNVAEVESSDVFYLCKRDKTTRWLRAHKLENGKCQTLYSKEGYLQVISSATYFASCEGVLQSVRKNLEEGQFKCDLTTKYSVLELQ